MTAEWSGGAANAAALIDEEGQLSKKGWGGMTLHRSDVVDPRTGKVTIPEGYQWCGECEALTPHAQDPRRSWRIECVVCGESASCAGHSCPNCGWAIPDADEEASVEEEIIQHLDGCHCKQVVVGEEDDPFLSLYPESTAEGIVLEFRKTNKPLHLREKVWYKATRTCATRCWCPRATIFRLLYQFGHWRSPGHSMECYNPMDWGWSNRCPICGEVFDVDDGNC